MTPSHCVPKACSLGKTSSPSCICGFPYTGTFTFRAPSFSDLDNNTHYQSLEESLMHSFQSHNLPVDSVSLSNPAKDSFQYLNLRLQVFPSNQDRFNRTGIFAIGFLLSNQTFKPPKEFGPFFFKADEYDHFGTSGKYVFHTVEVILVKLKCRKHPLNFSHCAINFLNFEK